MMKFRTSHFIFHTSYLIVLCLCAIAFSSSAAELKEIEERGKLIVGVKDNLRPLGFRNVGGNLQGLEIDIARRLAAELLGSPDAVVLQSVANRDRLSVVLEGKVDLAIARVTATVPRSRLVYFSAPYYLDGTGLVTKDNGVQNLSNVSGAKIAVLKESSTISVVRYVLPTARLVGVDSYEQARSLLETGSVAAFAADNSVLAGWVQEYPQYRLLPVRLSGEALCVVMPKGLQHDRLNERVDRAIAKMKSDGWLQERVKYWGLP